MAIDVTDETFETEVINRSTTTPVVVYLWSPRSEASATLGAAIEQVVDQTNGAVVLVKVDVDQNPAIAQAFKLQSIPAVYALDKGQVVDGVVGPVGEPEIRELVDRLLPSQEAVAVNELIATGDEGSLRLALQMDPANEDAIVALSEMLVGRGENDEALTLLERIPETDRTRRIAAKARVDIAPDDDHDATLKALLDRVKDDDDARQQFVDILELMGPDDPRTARYRRQLTARLF